MDSSPCGEAGPPTGGVAPFETSEEGRAVIVATHLETARDIASRTGRSIVTVRAWTHRDDFPPPVDVGARGVHWYLRADVDRWLGSHPAVAGPPPVAADGDGAELVTLSQFAARIGKARGTVYQYENRPAVVDGNRYRLGDLLAWWDARPGQGSRSDLD